MSNEPKTFADVRASIEELRASLVSQVNKLLERDRQVIELRAKLANLTMAAEAAIPEMICTCNGKIDYTCNAGMICAKCKLFEVLKGPNE